MRVALEISLTNEERAELAKLARSKLTTGARAVLCGDEKSQVQALHTRTEWLKFLRQIDREAPKGKNLHLIADNYATHKHPAVQACPAKGKSV